MVILSEEVFEVWMRLWSILLLVFVVSIVLYWNRLTNNIDGWMDGWMGRLTDTHIFGPHKFWQSRNLVIKVAISMKIRATKMKLLKFYIRTETHFVYFHINDIRFHGSPIQNRAISSETSKAPKVWHECFEQIIIQSPLYRNTGLYRVVCLHWLAQKKI